MTQTARLAVDIGGTFTDIALEFGERVITDKVLTTPRAPQDGVLQGVRQVLAQADIEPADIGLIIHGTTLATNALIERKGAKTALIVTEGFRDSVEMAYENRFEQYDINMERPPPLVPRYLRLPVLERVNARGDVLIPLDEASVKTLIPTLQAQDIDSIAIGLIHAYTNPAHEQRIAEIVQAVLPDTGITLSSDVCPEIREYERLSTTCANAYVQPLMARYLTELDQQLRQLGLNCPFLLMTSGGGLCTLETAVRFPIRLVESGPAGGAILASRIAKECSLEQVLSFDMGGTTAKICLIDDYQPLTSRSFEVAREYRFLKGSGLPIRIPCIEMVEIGAGGGSIATVDAMQRIAVGPESAGSEPGPACYDRGGTEPTVTDADVVLGRIEPDRFAGGSVQLAPEKAAQALGQSIGGALNLNQALAAFAVSEVVDENMANSARVHAIEWGKDIGNRTLIAFGGAAPLHAVRLAEKLGLKQVLVPTDAGVGSAIGFLRAPIAFEAVRSRYLRLSEFDPAIANNVLEAMRTEAYDVVRNAAPDTELEESRFAYMRYYGQGHEISVALPERPLTKDDVQTLQAAFDAAYTQLYGRVIPNLDVEILSWTLTVSTIVPEPITASAMTGTASQAAESVAERPLFDPTKTDYVTAAIYRREDLQPGVSVSGPALIIEDQTTTVVASSFVARINELGYIVLEHH